MNYIFEHAQDAAEYDRLQLLQRLHDPRTHRLIDDLDLPADGHCCEIGPGAGSIMRWIATTVVPRGHVTAIDLNTSFCAPGSPTNVTLTQANLLETELEPQSFDLIHGRFVIVFMPEYPATLAKLVEALRPGGWLVLEEVDFTCAAPLACTAPARTVFEAVNTAIVRMFRSGGLDPAMGTRLTSLFDELSLHDVKSSTDDAAGPGGSLVAAIMKRSTHKLRDAYLATGAVTEAQLETYAALCDDPGTALLHHRTVRIRGRSPR